MPPSGSAHPVILLPPSEGKSHGGSRPGWKASSGILGSELSAWRTQIAAALRKVDGGDSALLGVKGPHLEQARAANATLIGAPTMPAWQRYTGVVWDHIDPATLSTSAMRRAHESVIVVSGLLGLVGFEDPIPDYKLKIGASLELPRVSGGTTSRQALSSFWQPRLSPILDTWIRGRTVIDLLPLEHRRAWLPETGIQVIRVAFVDRRGRKAGHDAKAAKGLFVRHILTERSPMRALDSWTHPEYRVELTR